MRAIGLMSGTSMDGIDIAVIETDGERVTRFGPSAIHYYNENEKSVLRGAMETLGRPECPRGANLQPAPTSSSISQAKPSGARAPPADRRKPIAVDGVAQE